MNFEELSKEQQIMVMMRKVLTTIIRETAPTPDRSSPFSEQTIEDIRLCLQLITAREQALLEAKGVTNTARPYYVDEPSTSHVVSFHKKPKD
jgi:hypothetical protein